MNLGERIKFYREAAGMSQTELATHLDVGRAAVNKYEKGVIENIPIKTIEHIAELLSVTPQELLGWNDQDSTIPFEYRVSKALNSLYGTSADDVMNTFQALDKVGQRKALQYLKDLTKIYGKESGN